MRNYLELVEEFMDKYGYDEDTASREAFATMYPEKYDADDYDACGDYGE